MRVNCEAAIQHLNKMDRWEQQSKFAILSKFTVLRCSSFPLWCPNPWLQPPQPDKPPWLCSRAESGPQTPHWHNTCNNGLEAALTPGCILSSGAVAAPNLVVLPQHEGLVDQGRVALEAAEAVVVPVAVLEVQLLEWTDRKGGSEGLRSFSLPLSSPKAKLLSCQPGQQRIDLLFLSLSDWVGRATAPLQALKGRTFNQTHWHNHIHFGLSGGQKMIQINGLEIWSSASVGFLGSYSPSSSGVHYYHHKHLSGPEGNMLITSVISYFYT